MGITTWELPGIRAGILYIPARTSLLCSLVGYRIVSTNFELWEFFYFFFFQDLLFLHWMWILYQFVFFYVRHESMSPLEFILQRVTSPHACSFFLFLLKFNTLKKFVLTRTPSHGICIFSFFFFFFEFFSPDLNLFFV